MTDEPLIVLRLELDGVRRHVAHMMQNNNAEIVRMAEAAMQEQLTDARVSNLIQSIAKTEVERAVREATEQYFRWGDGRKTLRKVIDGLLDEALRRPEE